MRQIAEFPDYTIDENGNVYKGSKKISHNVTSRYVLIGLNKNNKAYSRSIHRLLAITFIPNPENKPCINHINGIKKDNRIENLEWCTKKENIQHAVRTGLKKGMPADSHPMRKLDSVSVYIIREACLLGVKQKELARYFNVDFRTISQIKTNRRWASI